MQEAQDLLSGLYLKMDVTSILKQELKQTSINVIWDWFWFTCRRMLFQ